MDNIIVVTVQEVFTILLTLSVLAMGAIQWAKEQFSLQNRAAEILSLVVGFLLSGLVGLYWVDLNEYTLELGQWIGVGIAVVVGGLGPSGGYKLIGTFSGKRQNL